MPSFDDAFNRFKETGFFFLETAEVYAEQLEKLQHAASYLKEDKPKISPYQFHLNQVRFIFGHLPRPERLMEGAITEHRLQDAWDSGIPDVALLKMARPANAFTMDLRFDDPNGKNASEEMVELALWKLLDQIDTWSSIKIDWVYYFLRYKQYIPNYLGGDFHRYLLARLAQRAGISLKELSLKPFSLSKRVTALVDFLGQSTSLEILHLDIIDTDKESWLRLAQALTICPKLECLDLGNTRFDEYAAAALSQLLDENYRIKKITIAAPSAHGSMLEAYHQLNRRLSTPCAIRFKEERLSQGKLLELALQILVESEKNQRAQPSHRGSDGREEKQARLVSRFNFLLSDQGALALTDTEKVTWLKGVDVLPVVYSNHQEYMKEFSSLVQLHLGALVLGGPNTVGYLLLERALEVKETPIIRCLLEANADLFEPPPEGIKQAFLVRLFETEGPWQQEVIRHLKKDLNILVPAVKVLSPYARLAPICTELKEHLNRYFTLLEQRRKQPTLLRLLSGVMSNFQDRHEECAQSFHNLVWYIKIATDESAGKKVTYDSLFEAQEILEQLLENSSQANRGFLGRSKLHDDLLRLGKELNKELKRHQRDLYYREKNKLPNYLTGACVKDNPALEAMRITLEQEQEGRKQERERHAQEQKEMKAKIEELKQLMQQQNRRQARVPAEATPEEESEEASVSFFARR